MIEDQTTVADLVMAARDPRASIASQHRAFARLVGRFEAMALVTARDASPDLDFARDACQAAFLSAWRKLRTLREPAAFGLWLKRLIRTHCARERRRRQAVHHRVASALAVELASSSAASDPTDVAEQGERESQIRTAIDALPDEERAVVTLFHLRGRSLRGVARSLGISVARAGKIAYSGRLRLRRTLPRTLTDTFLVKRPAPAFTRRVRAGAFDEFVGEYRFPARPDQPIVIQREGSTLASYAGGQRNVLVSRAADSFEAVEFDGEARFRRDDRGVVSHFVYYEFGRRLGVAHKAASFPA